MKLDVQEFARVDNSWIVDRWPRSSDATDTRKCSSAAWKDLLGRLEESLEKHLKGPGAPIAQILPLLRPSHRESSKRDAGEDYDDEGVAKRPKREVS